MSNEDETLYECAMSGETAMAAESDTSDGLDDLPLGWTRIVLERRVENPDWLAVQTAKSLSLQLALQASGPLGEDEVFSQVILMQVEAQYAALEARTPQYLAERDVVYISDSGDIIDEVNEVREALGLDAVEPYVSYAQLEAAAEAGGQDEDVEPDEDEDEDGGGGE